MLVGTTGILVNESGQVLLIRRDDTGKLAPPGGSLEIGELPTEGVARELLEETGVKVLPVRLVGIHFISLAPGYLTFVFRCLQKGGDLRPSPESPEVGFFKTTPFPAPMFGPHRDRVERGLAHTGGRPYWGVNPPSLQMKVSRFYLRQVVYRWKEWQRRRAGRPPFVPPPVRRVTAFTIIQNEARQVLWVRRQDNGLWNLPGGRGKRMEPPWQTAARETREETGLDVELVDLTGVYLYRERPRIVFVFTAVITGGRLITGAKSAEFGYYAPGAEPENTVRQHQERAADALSFTGKIPFRWQEPWKK